MIMSRWTGLGAALCLAASVGCGSKEPDSMYIGAKSAKQAVDDLKEEFADSKPDYKKRADSLWNAVDKGDYETALNDAMYLNGQPAGSMSKNEALSVHHTYMNLQEEIARNAERGDPAALNAMRMIRGRRD